MLQQLENKLIKIKQITENTKINLLFPGQASQYKSMGMDWYNQFPIYRKTFDYINQKIKSQYKDYIDTDLISLLEDESKINITLYSQILIFSVSVSCFECIKDILGDKISCLAGHSLGEYSALVCSQSLTLDQGIDLVVKRGYFMHNYSKEGTMFAVIDNFNPQTIQKLQTIVQNYNSTIANYNSYSQLIISCPVEKSEELKKEIKLQIPTIKILPLKVSGAFHSYMMQEANNYLSKHIDQVNFNSPKLELYINSQNLTDPNQIKQEMKNQMINPVNWILTIEKINQKYPSNIFLELMPNKILSNLIRKGFDKSISEKVYSIEEL
ncbi:MAG: ACP S-malonyltransferase [bacterium]